MAVIEKQAPQMVDKTHRSAPESPTRSNLTLLFFLSMLFALILPREFGGTDSPARARIYEPLAAGFRPIDLIVLGVVSMTIMARAGAGRLFKLYLPRDIGRWAALFGLAIVIATIYGSLTGGTELFFDWRGVAVGVAFMVLIYQLLRAHPSAVAGAGLALIMVLGTRAVIQLLNFFTGATTVTILGQRIPVFDGPTLSNTVFVGIASACLAFGWHEAKLNVRIVLTTTSFVAFLLVALAFRRTYWGEACVALLVIVLIFNKRRVAVLLTALIAFVVFVPFLPNEFALRAGSANPFAPPERNEYTVTNEDHLNDVRDAWDVIKKDPLLGYGLGNPYTTDRIREWKDVSWEVHNGPLHVWLRYGALGLLSYLGLHFTVLRWLLRLIRRFKTGTFERCWLLTIFSYISATFSVSLFATPWAYGATQNSLLIFTLIATALVIQNGEPRLEKLEATNSKLPA